jgi:hypothetical protein
VSYYRGVEAQPLASYCKSRRISRRAGRRWVADGRLQVVGRQRSKRGKSALLVVPAADSVKPQTRKKPVWTQFVARCEEKLRDPRKVLLKLLAGSRGDPDLLHAAIRLTLHDYFQGRITPLMPCFLDYLYRKIPKNTDPKTNDFPSFVAETIRSKLPRSMYRVLKQKTFRDFWHEAQNHVATWTPNSAPCHFYDPNRTPAVNRLAFMPVYIRTFRMAIPPWAAESVCSMTRQQPKWVYDALAKIYAASVEKDPDDPFGRNDRQVPLAMNFGSAIVAAKNRQEKEAVRLLVEMGLRAEQARRFLRLWMCREGIMERHSFVPEHDESKERVSGFRLSHAAVNRVFCIGIEL